jgi:hypothetical protein
MLEQEAWFAPEGEKTILEPKKRPKVRFFFLNFLTV